MKKTLEQNEPVEETEKLITRHLKDLGSRAASALISFYIKTENYERGLTITKTLLKKRPQDISLLNAQSNFLMKLGKLEEAIELMQVCDNVAPQNIERIERMVDAYLRTNRYRKSVQKMRQLMNLHPERPEYKYLLFNKIFDYGYDDQCLEFCRDVSTPQDVLKYYNNRGILMSRNERHKEAVKCYKKALSIYPNFPGNYKIQYNIALAFLKQKTPEARTQAKTFLKLCLDNNPRFAKAQSLYVRVMSESGDA